MLKSVRPAAAVLALLSLGVLSLGASAAPAPEQVALHGRTANVGGLWCGAGLLNSFSLDIRQQLQSVQGKLIRKNRVREITGHVDGVRVITDSQRDHRMELVAQGNELRIIAATGMLALAEGQFFTRAVGGSCTH